MTSHDASAFDSVVLPFMPQQPAQQTPPAEAREYGLDGLDGLESPVGPVLSRSADLADGASLLGMPLAEYARVGQMLEVRTPWWPDTFYFVPAACDAAALRREGIARHRVWTAEELASLFGPPAVSVVALSMITLVRREFDAEIVEVRPRSDRPAR
jgi:hypothetical protein